MIPRFAAVMQIVVIADPGGSVIADPVGDAALTGGRGEAVRMRDDPVGHVAAIAAPGNAQPQRISNTYWSSRQT